MTDQELLNLISNSDTSLKKIREHLNVPIHSEGANLVLYVPFTNIREPGGAEALLNFMRQLNLLKEQHASSEETDKEEDSEEETDDEEDFDDAGIEGYPPEWDVKLLSGEPQRPT